MTTCTMASYRNDRDRHRAGTLLLNIDNTSPVKLSSVCCLCLKGRDDIEQRWMSQSVSEQVNKNDEQLEGMHTYTERGSE